MQLKILTYLISLKISFAQKEEMGKTLNEN